MQGYPRSKEELYASKALEALRRILAEEKGWKATVATRRLAEKAFGKAVPVAGRVVTARLLLLREIEDSNGRRWRVEEVKKDGYGRNYLVLVRVI